MNKIDRGKLVDFMILYLQKFEKLNTEERTYMMGQLKVLIIFSAFVEEKKAAGAAR